VTTSDEAVRVELGAIEDEWALAIVSNDADEIARFIGDDWALVSDSGVMPAERFLAVIRSGDLTHSAMAAVGGRRIRIFGSTAVVTARMISTAHYRDQRIDTDEWTTDVFVRSGNRWLCELTHLTAASAPTAT
jgi:ketosteroid isomerase-like protein